jgi:Rad3-related DNA helicase
MLQDAFRPEELTSPELQRAVDEALDYRSRVAAAVREQRDSVLKDELLQTAQQFDEWLEEIYGLAQRLDRYNKDRHIHDRNRKRAEERVRQLEKQLQREASPAVRQEIDSNLAAIRRQLEAITQLDDAMARAALRLENTVTAMGTIYTQVTLMGAKDIDSGRSRRLRLEISEEVTELSDVLAAMDEVYATEGAS